MERLSDTSNRGRFTSLLAPFPLMLVSDGPKLSVICRFEIADSFLADGGLFFRGDASMESL